MSQNGDFAMLSSSYNSEEGHEKESDPFVPADSSYAQRKLILGSFWSWRPNLWTVTTFIMASVLFGHLTWGAFHTRDELNTSHTYEKGFETDWAPAKEALKIKRVKFYGGLYFDSNESLVATVNPEEPLYVGPPSQEIDDAWQDLVRDRYLTVSYEEAKEISHDVFFWRERGGYSVGIDSLHSLHCLNVIRKAQDYDYYISKGMPPGELSRLHIDHCINHIRQIIQCHADMTPLPMLWADIGGGRTVPDFDQEHTCRDFSAIREWSTRKQESGIKKAVEKYPDLSQ